MPKDWWDKFRKTKRSRGEAAPLTSDQKILKEIAKVLWSIFDEDAKFINFKGQLFDEVQESQITLERDDGTIFWTEKTSGSHDLIDEIFELLKKLQQTERFSAEKFTHTHIRLSDNKALSAEFAYVNQEDNWSGLYMRGVSELTQADIKEFYIPQKDWEERFAKFGKTR